MFNTPQKQKHFGLALNNIANSKNKFHFDQELDRNLDNSKTILQKKPTLKQTKLCLRKSLISVESNANDVNWGIEQKAELFIMPLPNKKYISNNVVMSKKPRLLETKSQIEAVVEKHPNQKLLAMIGNVDFAINMMKTYKSINVLWDIFGRLIKVTDGKIRFEKNLLLRSIFGNGPVLQCTYFDMKGIVMTTANGNTYSLLMKGIHLGCCVRVIGNMTAGNKLRVHKIKFLNKAPEERHLNRLQNVNSFVLQKNCNTK